jgi:hypothetical protein
MLKATPGMVRDPKTGREEPGLIELFVRMLPNGRCERKPVFRPLYLLTTSAERAAVVSWLRRHRPDLLPHARHKR